MCNAWMYLTQIGDLTEIMYFVAHSQDEMEEWLRAFRHGKNHHAMIKVIHLYN